MKIYLSLSLLIFILSSCAFKREIDVKDFRKDASENLTSAERGLGIITSDLANLSVVLTKWSDAESKSRLNKLKQSRQNLQQYYIRTKEDFQRSPLKTKETVSSEDKNYEQIKKERDDFQARLETLDEQLDKYKKQRNALTNYLESKGIYKVDSHKINSDFIHALNESKKTQREVKNRLMDYNVKLNQSEAPTDEKKAIIKELVKIVEKIENHTFRLQRLHTSLAREIGKNSVFVTPEMKAYGYKDKIKLHSENVQKLVSEFNELSEKLK